ncbi:MAG: FAD-dependent oxidoreductase, partial [Pseudomonadota bacterium]
MKVAVVGCGLIGSAAARHLAKAGHEVLLIGPDEPADKRHHQGVFGSHYDEGRITRRLATDQFWSEVSSASIDRYAEIAVESGIRFHTPCGAMMAADAFDPMIQKAAAVRDALGLDCMELTGASLAETVPYFAFPQGIRAFHEVTDGGHISPRALVQAQSRAAQKHGAIRVSEAVRTLRETRQGVIITTKTGEHDADAALLTAGAMTDHISPATIPLKVYGRTVALFEVDEAQAAQLSTMPSVVFRLKDNAGEPYLLPPIRYPDGKIYLKLGGDPDDLHLET